MNENMVKVPVMLSIRETAKRTGISQYVLRRWIAEKRIVCVTCGKKYLVNYDSVLGLLNGAETAGNTMEGRNYAEQ